MVKKSRLPGLRRPFLAFLSFLLLVPVAVARAQDEEAEPSRFGVIESYVDPAMADRLGVGWTRVRFQWAEVQPEEDGEWQLPVDDETLQAELEAGREVIGLIIGIPDWARDRNGVPEGLNLPHDDDGNTWAVFVGELAARYAGQIDHWIIWNEPDIDDPDAPGHTWDGTIEEFAQLQRVAYLAAKEANPDAIIHLSAVTYFWDPDYLDRLLNTLAADPEAAGNGFYFDVATAHLYFQPDTIYDILNAFRDMLDGHGLDKPIWLVETNAPPADDTYWTVPNWTLYVTIYEQAAFIPQAMASALAAGAERVAVFKLKDTEQDREANPEPFGLVRWDSSRRPAFDSYRVAIPLMAGVTSAERERWDAVGQIRLDQPDQTTTVLFTRLPQEQTAEVPATAGTAELIDMWGRRESIEAEDGVFAVDLPGALCTQTIADYCMIGGTTYYLVQALDRPIRRPSATPIRPSPTSSPAATAEPSATPSPSATPEPTPGATPAPATPASAPATLTPAPATPGHTPTPMATLAPTATVAADSGAREVPGYLGFGLIGLGLLAAVGLVAWAVYGRRGD